MLITNISEANARFSAFIQKVVSGQEVIIRKAKTIATLEKNTFRSVTNYTSEGYKLRFFW